MNTFFKSAENDFVLYNGDCVEVMSHFPDNTFQTIFADPPYFLSKGGFRTRSGQWMCLDKADWDKSISPEEMDAFNMKWLSACRRLLKDDGTIWVSGTYHNIFSVADCLKKTGYKILNIITWQKTDPRPLIEEDRFTFSTEQIIWARKSECHSHKFNAEKIRQLNYGRQMTDVWNLPSVAFWEKKLGKHPTQKPLSLLYRIIISCSDENDWILDPFNGSGTTGIASKVLNRKYVGIDLSSDYLNITEKRYHSLENPTEFESLLVNLHKNTEEPTVLVNRVRLDTFDRMLETGICYLRAGDSRGSLLVTRGFERLGYVLLTTKGREPKLFKLASPGFQIWTQKEVNQHGFIASHASYYAVLHFDNTKSLQINNVYSFCTCSAKILPLGLFYSN